MKEENRAIVVTSIISGVILIIAFAFLLRFQPASSENSVNVQGNAVVKAMPDLISIYFNIETKGNTSAEAASANSKILDNLTEALIRLGFAEEEIQTENFNVYPNTYWDGKKQREEGFVAHHSLKFELSSDEFNQISEVIDAGVNAGAGIGYINFELSRESQNKYKAEALKLAAEDARIKAESVAEGFGKSVGKLISVSINDFGYYPWNVYTSVAKGYAEEDVMQVREIAANIQPTEEEINAVVTALYKLR